MNTQTGRPVEFSEEVIVQAGQALRDRDPKRNITGFALRKIIGGGNPTRLKQVWDEHEAKQSIAESEPVAELPVEVAEEMAKVAKSLNDRLYALASELNDRAVKAAERRVAEVVRAAGDQRQQAESELADASQAVDELEDILDEERAKVEGLEKRLADALATNQDQAVELAKLRERLESSERNAKVVYDRHVDELAKATTTNKKLEQELNTLVSERDQLRMELASVKAKSEAAEESHQEQRKRTAEEIQRASDKLIKIEGERDKAKMEAGKAREESAKLAGQLEAVQNQVAQLMDAITKSQKSSAPKKTTSNE